MGSATFNLPATPKQVAYARSLAMRTDTVALGRFAGSKISQRVDRRTVQTETLGHNRKSPDLQASGLRRAPRAHQAPFRA